MSLTSIDGGGGDPPELEEAPMRADVTSVVLGQAVPPGGGDPVVVLRITTETVIPFAGNMGDEMRRLLEQGKLTVVTEMPKTPPPGAA